LRKIEILLRTELQLPVYVRWNDVSQERFFGVPSAWSGDAPKVKLAAMILDPPKAEVLWDRFADLALWVAAQEEV